VIIPKLHYISQGNSPNEHIANIQKACSSGAELVQLRLKNVSEKRILKIATEAREVTAHFQTRLIINDHYKIAKAIKADGVHLGQNDSCPVEARKHLYTWQMIGGTANTVQECEKLISKEVDYISLGPLRETNTKTDFNKVLGINGYTVIIASLNTAIPILGVGGITTADVVDLINAGVAGLAISEEITKNFDSIRSFHQLLNAASTQEQRHTFE
jgi:thiamine-phosphate pyrophosphorylase